MKIPDMNEKNTRAFLDKVRERASSYTPEWRMDLENPDGGTALALLFAGMYEDTLKKYAQLPRKSMLDFFNCAAGRRIRGIWTCESGGRWNRDPERDRTSCQTGGRSGRNHI